MANNSKKDLPVWLFKSTKFTIQEHHSKRSGKHWDLRILHPSTNKVFSWVFPKRAFPTGKQKALAIWVDDKHSVDYMTFEGELSSGDPVTLYDIGSVDVYTSGGTGRIDTIDMTKDIIYFIFYGKKIKGMYLFIKIKNSKNRIVLKSKNKKFIEDV